MPIGFAVEAFAFEDLNGEAFTLMFVLIEVFDFVVLFAIWNVWTKSVLDGIGKVFA